SQSWFGRVQHKPGSHQGVSLWAHDDRRQVPVVSLPGNPVAAFVSFHLYVHPLLNKLRGKADMNRPPKISAQVVGEPPHAVTETCWCPRLWISHNSQPRSHHFMAAMSAHT